jgi:hypothetical protein
MPPCSWPKDELLTILRSVYDDFDALLRHPGLEAIVIASETSRHAELSIKALDAGLVSFHKWARLPDLRRHLLFALSSMCSWRSPSRRIIDTSLLVVAAAKAHPQQALLTDESDSGNAQADKQNDAYVGELLRDDKSESGCHDERAEQEKQIKRKQRTRQQWA